MYSGDVKDHFTVEQWVEPISHSRLASAWTVNQTMAFIFNAPRGNAPRWFDVLKHSCIDRNDWNAFQKGYEMPANFFSQNVVSEIDVSAINIFEKDLKMLQAEDSFIHSISDFIQLGKSPLDPHQAAYVRFIAPSCIIENDILWHHISCHNMPHRNILLLPLSLSDEIIQDTHSSLLSGHEGISRTKKRLLLHYFLPNTEAKISQHVNTCLCCHTSDKPKPPVLTSMPQCTSLNQRMAGDLMGPLRTSYQEKTLCFMHD